MTEPGDRLLDDLERRAREDGCLGRFMSNCVEHTPDVRLWCDSCLMGQTAQRLRAARAGDGCLVCKEIYEQTGQQTRSPFQISGPTFLICRRCVEAGRAARAGETATTSEEIDRADAKLLPALPDQAEPTRERT